MELSFNNALLKANFKLHPLNSFELLLLIKKLLIATFQFYQKLSLDSYFSYLQFLNCDFIDYFYQIYI